MILYRTTRGAVLEHRGAHYAVPGDWDELFNRPDFEIFLRRCARQTHLAVRKPDPAQLLPPIGSQEVWAAGVTYNRSRMARMSESKKAASSDFYDRVYHAERPELFFKATPHRVVGHGGVMHLRRDSSWVAPEPEITLAIDARGRLVGYTIGNDLSCRDIEGENPLWTREYKPISDSPSRANPMLPKTPTSKYCDRCAVKAIASAGAASMPNNASAPTIASS